MSSAKPVGACKPVATPVMVATGGTSPFALPGYTVTEWLLMLVTKRRFCAYAKPAHRCSEGRGRDLIEARAREQLVDQTGPPETQQSARVVRIARRQSRMLERSRNECADARILLRPRKHHNANAAAGFERTIHFAQSLQ